MLKQEIKLQVLEIDGEEVHYQMKLSNEINSTMIDFYGYLDEFENFGNGLLNFPKTINDEVKYELGEEGEKWAYYILLRVFCYETNGHSAIQIKIDNNEKEPFSNKCEFYIKTVPAALNKFGQLLKSWNPKTENDIIWIAD